MKTTLLENSSVNTISPLCVIENGMQICLDPEDIVYLEGNGKYCIIRTVNETYNSAKTLSEALGCLPEDRFCRTHKSFAVNIDYIKTFDKSVITFSNGEKALISKTFYASFSEFYNQNKR